MLASMLGPGVSDAVVRRAPYYSPGYNRMKRPSEQNYFLLTMLYCLAIASNALQAIWQAIWP